MMKAGDMVRFRRPPVGAYDAPRHGGNSMWLLGLLVEYHKWEKIATILYRDELLRIPARDVQKFGRRYLEE